MPRRRGAAPELTRLPEFAALTKVLAALRPLSPEGRRKVVEAVHALLEVSPGRAPAHSAGRR